MTIIITALTGSYRRARNGPWHLHQRVVRQLHPHSSYIGKLDLSANDMVLEGKKPACHMMCPPKHINLVHLQLWPSVLGRLGRNRGVIHLGIEAQSAVKVRIIVSCKL